MKKIIYLCLIFSLFAACNKTKEKTSVPEGALVRVGSEYITQEDFEQRAQDLDKDFASYIRTDLGRKNFLDLMVAEALFTEEADNQGITKTPNYKEGLDALKQQQALALKKFEQTTKIKMLIDKLKEQGTITVTEDEIRAYYRRYSYQIHLLHILLDDAEKASVITRELKRTNNQKSFEEQARRFSIDASTKRKGGALQPFIPGEYMPEIEIPAANTPLNQVQGFIKTAHGFHIIMKVKEEKLTYSQAKERIEQILEKQKMDAYLESLRNKYGVEVINEGK